MNDRPTPETDASCIYISWVNGRPRERASKAGGYVHKALAKRLERERDELRELYDLDTQWLKAENAANIEQLSLIADVFGYDDTIGGESLAVYMARMVGKLRNENAALRDALRVRIDYVDCPDCGGEFVRTGHAETCRHYQTERELIK